MGRSGRELSGAVIGSLICQPKKGPKDSSSAGLKRKFGIRTWSGVAAETATNQSPRSRPRCWKPPAQLDISVAKRSSGFMTDSRRKICQHMHQLRRHENDEHRPHPVVAEALCTLASDDVADARWHPSNYPTGRFDRALR
jgi:hypothetical protein